jgi:hypothetical protein
MANDEVRTMMNQGQIVTNHGRQLAGRAALLAGCAALLAWAGMPDVAFAQEAAPQAPTAYRDIPYIGSRNLVWIIAQLHLLLAGFVLGVPIFAWLCEIVGWKSGDKRYDKLAKEFTKLLTSSYATTALFGGILLFLLIGFYPKLMAYLTDIFFPSFLVYCGLFLVETATLYLYWYGWDAMAEGSGKKFHIFLGFLLNVFAFFIMIVPNSWATFQSSPVVISEGSDFARAWAATWNPTWWPVNIHRLIANVVLGGYICGAYAGIRYLSAKSQEERYHYDWMGYVGNFIGVFGLLPLPFAGYWLMREIYQYNQQMGITLMGGFLSWLFILQAMLIGVLFLGSNYYFWLGITHRIPGSETQYRKPIMAMLIILLLCLGVWMTPHSLVASLEEAQKMGGTHHPLLGVFGVMSAKMTVSNLMVLVTFMSFIMYWRAGKARYRRMGQGRQSSHGRRARVGSDSSHRARCLGLLRSRYYPHQLLLYVPGGYRHLCDVDDYSAHCAPSQERQDHHRNGVGKNATTRRLCAGIERGHGHPAHDPHGLCAFFIPRSLAHLRCDARFLPVRVFSRAWLCGRADGAEHVLVLYVGGFYFLGCHDGRQGQGRCQYQRFGRARSHTRDGRRVAGAGWA